MKKARILLASIAVVGILGGTFAFKAANRGTRNYYVATTVTNAYSTVPLGFITPTGAPRYYTTIYGATANAFGSVASGL
jgi:uncharacterized protein YxeA